MKEDIAYFDILMRKGSYLCTFVIYQHQLSATLSGLISAPEPMSGVSPCCSAHTYLGISSDTFLWQAIGYDAFDKEGVKM